MYRCCWVIPKPRIDSTLLLPLDVDSYGCVYVRCSFWDIDRIHAISFMLSLSVELLFPVILYSCKELLLSGYLLLCGFDNVNAWLEVTLTSNEGELAVEAIFWKRGGCWDCVCFRLCGFLGSPVWIPTMQWGPDEMSASLRHWWYPHVVVGWFVVGYALFILLLLFILRHIIFSLATTIVRLGVFVWWCMLYQLHLSNLCISPHPFGIRTTYPTFGDSGGMLGKNSKIVRSFVDLVVSNQVVSLHMWRCIQWFVIRLH